jgi:hypothetical protein
MKERLSETQLASPSPSTSTSPSRSRTSTRQRLYTLRVAAVVTVAVIAPQCCQGFSLSSPDVASASRNALLLERRPVIPVLAPYDDRPAQQSSSSSSASTTIMSLQDFQMQQQPPVMFLHPRRMTSVSSSLTTSSSSSSTRDRTRPPVSPLQKIPSGRVLGFDISSTLTSTTMATTTALQATRRKKSSVNVETWNGVDVDVETWEGVADFFPAPSGLLWKNSNSQNKQQLSQPLKKLVLDEQTLKAPTLPLWFPWLATKLQIQELKVTELKEACVQRGLKKVCTCTEHLCGVWT